MASRLSDEKIRAAYDSGQQALAVEALSGRSGGDWLLSRTLDELDLDRLADREDALEVIQGLAPQDVYRALTRRGLQDSLEILPLLSDEQIVRIWDYDVWRNDRLAPLEVSRWLALWREVGTEELSKRFRALDEEYQIGFLTGMVEMFDEEEFENLSQADQYSLTRLPCNTLFYRLKTPAPQVEENIQALIAAVLAEDVAYAYSLLNHAAYMPPNEAEASLAQFRRARLEEDGFVSYEESQLAFRPVDLDALARQWSLEAGVSSLQTIRSKDEVKFLGAAINAAAAFDPAVGDGLLRSLAHLSNAVCAASHVETEDLEGQRRVLALVHAYVNLGLQWLSGNDLQRAAQVLRSEHVQVLFRVGLSLLRRLADAVLMRMAQAQLPKSQELTKLYRQNRFGRLLYCLDVELLPVLGLERVELMKGLLNRFPMMPRAVSEAGAAPRFVFVPIDSLSRLREVVSQCDELTVMMTLSELIVTSGPVDGQDIEILVATAIARAFAGGALTPEPLTRLELTRLESLTPDMIRALTADISLELEERMRAMPSWSASALSGFTAEQPLSEVVQTVFHDLTGAVMVARENATHTADSTAWHGVVLVEGAIYG